MADKPTPPRQPDPRLSNLVLEGGRQKDYPPSVIPIKVNVDSPVRITRGAAIDFYLTCAALWVAIFIGLWLFVRGVH